MKKVLIASGVAVLAFATVVSAQSFTRNLTVGSTGADVSALQTLLISKGYSIPAISSGAATPGYFGSQTKTAVMAYQAANGIPNTGFVGPLTLASLNAGGVPAGSSVTCPAGLICTPVSQTPVQCPVGFICTPVGGGAPTTGSPAGITTPGVAGGLDATLRSTPSNGTDVKKGEEKAIASYDLEADDSDMLVSSIAINFNARLWLYAESISILDGSTIVASDTGLSSSDFTEVTAGSDYRIRFNNVNYVVPKNSKKVLTVRVKMLSFTDRSAATLTLGNFEVRATDGTGVTVTEDVTGDRTFDFVASNVGNVVATFNSASPTEQIVQTSTSGTTDGVTLLVFDLKAENRDLEVDTIKLALNASKALVTFGTLFDDIYLTIDGEDFSADTLASTTVFSDLGIQIRENDKVRVSVKANIADADDFTDGIMASTTLTASASNIIGEDDAFDTVTVTSATITSANTTFLQSGASITNTSTKVTPVGDLSDLVQVEFTFTVKAGDKNAVYVSAVPSTFVATSTTASSSSLTLISANASSLAGDSSGVHYIIPAGGSRTFTLSGSMNNDGGTAGTKEFKITNVYFDDDTSGLQEFNVDFGLEGLRATATLTN